MSDVNSAYYILFFKFFFDTITTHRKNKIRFKKKLGIFNNKNQNEQFYFAFGSHRVINTFVNHIIR